MISDDPELTAQVREKTQNTGLIVTEAQDPEEKTVYEMYYEYQEAIKKIPNHRILAINRGEKEKKLKVKVSVPVEDIQAGAVHGCSIFMQDCRKEIKLKNISIIFLTS